MTSKRKHIPFQHTACNVENNIKRENEKTGRQTKTISKVDTTIDIQ